jgi:hypothetical protein
LFHITDRTVFRRLDLLRLSDDAKGELRDGRLTLQDAYALADEAPEVQDELIEEARQAIEPAPEPAAEPADEPPLFELEQPQQRASARPQPAVPKLKIRKLFEEPPTKPQASTPLLDDRAAIARGAITENTTAMHSARGSVEKIVMWAAILPDGTEIARCLSYDAADKALREHQQAPKPQRADEECIAEARKVLIAYDKALRDGKSTMPFKERIEAIATEMNGGDHFGMSIDDGGEVRLARALAAKDGDEPIWGQPGRFEVTIPDDKYTVPVEIRTRGLFEIGEFGFAAHAVEPGMFISETGFRSFLVSERPELPKAGVSAWALACINWQRNTDEKGKPRKRPKPLVEYRPPSSVSN